MSECKHEFDRSTGWNCAKWCVKCDMPKCELQDRELADARKKMEGRLFKALQLEIDHLRREKDVLSGELAAARKEIERLKTESQQTGVCLQHEYMAVSRLRIALEWYANPQNYNGQGYHLNCEAMAKRASDALKGGSDEPTQNKTVP